MVETRRCSTRRLLQAGLAAALMLTTGACIPLDDAMVALFGRSMRSQPSFDPYEHPLPPPQNSVPFASGNFPAEPGQVNLGEPEGSPMPPPFDQGAVARQDPVVVGLVNPVPASPESLERGQELFTRACSPCHGTGGNGDGTVTQAGLPVWSLLTDQAMGYSDGHLYGMIRVGRGLMPAYGHQVTHFDRWNIVNYVRSLQQVQSAAPGGE